MKRKNIQNSNGITISDSIVMSVKQKHPSMRKLYAAIISIIGMLSVVMAFLGMFHFRYNQGTVLMAFLCFAAFHILTALKGGKALGAYLLSVLGFLFFAYKKSAKIVLGFKFVYNIIYRDTFDSKINFYKALKKSLEVPCVTTLFVFYIWLLSIVICYFTICRPNPVLPLMVTFPILEIGMYNGVKMPVFWGIMCIAYWLAILAMSTIDVGEYSGGQSGFVRKNNLFFPKRHMKLKVTERCGMFIIASVMVVAVFSYGFLKVTHYKRSDSINEKRRNISDAVEDFSFENIGESLANITNAFGFNFDYENHKLGGSDHVRYKNVTDLTVTLEKPFYSALYLKDYNGSIYEDNEWFTLPSSAYKDKIFDDFKSYDLPPQTFPALFTEYLLHNEEQNTIWIKNSPKKKRHIYSPYGVKDFGKLKFENDTLALANSKKQGETSYKFVPISPENMEKFLTSGIYESLFPDSSSGVHLNASSNTLQNSSRNVFSASEISDKKWRDAILEYCNENNLITYDDYFTVDYELPADPSYLYQHGNVLMAELLENNYKKFVYENYLDVPKNKDMDEVREAYSDIVDVEHGKSADEIFAILSDIRTRMAATSTYSLAPGKTPSTRDFINYFLLENHKGYCTHYASSGVILARMAGIPARYATGYILVENDIKAGKVNKDNSITIDVKDNRSHAWAEVYIDGMGWIPYEFTAGYSDIEINTDPTQPTTAATTSQASSTTTTGTSVSKTTGNSSLTTTHTTSTTTSSNAAATTIIKGGSKGSGIHIPKFIKNIFLFILFIAAVIMLIRARRSFILKLREKHFSTGDPRTRIRYMYTYAEKLLAEVNLRSEYGNYKQFASDVEKWHGEIYFEKGGFENLTDIALGSAFNNKVPSNEELKKCEKMLSDLGNSIFKKASRLEKYRLMYLTVLLKGE